jgi:kynurenine formamidase
MLGPETPLLKLPPDLGRDTLPVKVHWISEYNNDGPFWAWSWLELGEHSETHFNAPVHWITGRDHADGCIDTLPVQRLVTPVNILDFLEECHKDLNFLLTVDHVKAWEDKHGAIKGAEWVVL